MDRAFLNEAGLDPIALLKKIDKEFDLGGAVPYLAIRVAETGRTAMIVVRNTWDGSEKTTGVSADGLSEPQARLHPTARAELRKQADEKVLRLQSRYAPRTIRYSRILRWWLEKRLGQFKAAREKQNALLNRSRGIPDPTNTDDRDSHRVETWIEFLGDRTLATHTAEIGNEFNDWFRRRLTAAGKPIVGAHVMGGQDGTMGGYHSTLSTALTEFAEEYQAAVRLAFRKTRAKTNYEQRLATGITCVDVIKVLFFCLGFLWNEDGFAWEWVERDGKKRQRPLRLSGKALEAHLAFYMPVVRLVILYVLTGTRLRRIASLGWERDDYRGWIDLSRSMIVRNGRLSPDYKSKPRRPSRLLRLAARIFARWLRQDQARRTAEGWDDIHEGSFFVVHDGQGNAVENLAYRAKKAFLAVGIPNRRHDLKMASVGLFWYAGFDLRRIARVTGNDPDTLERHYLFLIEESEGVIRPKCDERSLTFLGFLDPERTCRRLPPSSRSGPPAKRKRERRIDV